MAEGKSVSLKAYLAIHESLLMNHEIRATNQKADPPRGGMVPDTFFFIFSCKLSCPNSFSPCFDHVVNGISPQSHLCPVDHPVAVRTKR